MGRSLCLLACALAACAAEPESDRRVQPLNGGSAGGPAAVVGLLADGDLFCSGTLITRRVVMTAAHCVAMLDPAAEVEAFFGAVIADGGDTVPVTDRLRHPEWSFDAQPYDIGLMALADDAPEAPIPASRRTLGDADEGQLAELVGFGKSSELAEDHGTKRTGMTPIAAIEPMRITIGPGPPTTCYGDSGGAVLLPDPDDGSPAVIGIHSRSDCEFLSLAERVDVHAATFIDPFVSEHPADCTEEPCDTGGCSAAPGASPALLLALLAVSRRRRGCARLARRADRAGPACARRRR